MKAVTRGWGGPVKTKAKDAASGKQGSALLGAGQQRNKPVSSPTKAGWGAPGHPPISSRQHWPTLSPFPSGCLRGGPESSGNVYGCFSEKPLSCADATGD